MGTGYIRGAVEVFFENDPSSGFDVYVTTTDFDHTNPKKATAFMSPEAARSLAWRLLKVAYECEEASQERGFIDDSDEVEEEKCLTGQL